MRPHEITLAGLARSFQITNIYQKLTVGGECLSCRPDPVAEKEEPVYPFSGLGGVKKRTTEILERVGLASMERHARRANSAMETNVTWEIGMTLATGPELLLPGRLTSGMSPAEVAQTMDLIKDLSRDVTIFLIEHNMDIVMNISDRIEVLNFGRKIAEGSPGRSGRQPGSAPEFIWGEHERPDFGRNPQLLRHQPCPALADFPGSEGRGSGLVFWGRNGAGKTTTIRSIIGLTPPRRGKS